MFSSRDQWRRRSDFEQAEDAILKKFMCNGVEVVRPLRPYLGLKEMEYCAENAQSDSNVIDTRYTM